MSSVNTERIKRAMSFFLPGPDNWQSLETSFAHLCSMKRQELHISHEAIDIFSKKQNKSSEELKILAKLKDDVKKGEILSRLIRHASLRIEDFFDRINLINWIQNKFERRDCWKDFRPLLIKDFHLDITSLMDSVGAVVIQMTTEGFKNKESPPYLLKIMPDSGRESPYRKKIPIELRSIIDLAAGWYKKVNKIRNILNHRPHEKIIFDTSSPGMFFQIYENGYSTPQILDDCFLYSKTEDGEIADFWLYAAWVISEVIVFLDDIGVALAKREQNSLSSEKARHYLEDFVYLLSQMQRLIKLIDSRQLSSNSPK